MIGQQLNELNRYCKLLHHAISYVNKSIIRRETYKMDSYEEAYNIDSVGRDYGAVLGAVDKWENRNMISWRMDENNLEEDESIFSAIDVLAKQAAEREKIPQTGAKILVQLMGRDERWFYEIKNMILYIAYHKGELDLQRPHKTQTGKWRYAVLWNSIPFHLPAKRSDSAQFGRLYPDSNFSPKQFWNITELHRDQIYSYVWKLYRYIEDNRKYLKGYKQFAEEQDM